MISVRMSLGYQPYPMVVVVEGFNEASRQLMEGPNLQRISCPAWLGERARVFLRHELQVHHEGHVGIRGGYTGTFTWVPHTLDFRDLRLALVVAG